MYIGEAASISFLQFVRDNVAAQIGPSQFSHNDQSDNMLETEPTISIPESITPAIEELDVTQRHDYIEAYRAAVRIPQANCSMYRLMNISDWRASRPVFVC